DEADRLREDGATAIFMGVDGRVAAIFAIAGPVKPSTPEALAALKAQEIRVVMLAGDNWTTARAVARQLGIDEVEAEVLPDQKSEVVQRHKAAGEVVAMASTTRLRSPQPTWASRWPPAQTSRWRARA